MFKELLSVLSLNSNGNEYQESPRKCFAALPLL